MNTKQSITEIIVENYYAHIPRILDSVEAFDSEWIYYSEGRKLHVEGREHGAQIGDIVVSVLNNLSIVDGSYILTVVHINSEYQELFMKDGEFKDLLRVENVRVEFKNVY